MQKALDVKLVILDVDGVMTDGNPAMLAKVMEAIAAKLG